MFSLFVVKWLPPGQMTACYSLGSGRSGGRASRARVREPLPNGGNWEQMLLETSHVWGQGPFTGQALTQRLGFRYRGAGVKSDGIRDPGLTDVWMPFKSPDV